MNNYYPIIRALYKDAFFYASNFEEVPIEYTKGKFLREFFAEYSLTKTQKELLMEVLGDIE